MLISPTDRDLFVLGEVSSLPEKWGCDVLFRTEHQWVGVQRKAIPDLIASVHDGRLAKEMGQMESCQRLGTKALVVEGVAKWTVDGVLAGSGFGSQWTRAQHRGILWSIASRGVVVDTTRDIDDTRGWLRLFERWCQKERHQALDRRPNAKGAWGKADSREFAVHMIQGLPNMGPELAGRIVDHFGKVPWAWCVSEQELMGVKGIGKKRARELIASLTPLTTSPSPTSVT